VGTFHQTTYSHIPEDSTLHSDAVKNHISDSTLSNLVRVYPSEQMSPIRSPAIPSPITYHLDSDLQIALPNRIPNILISQSDQILFPSQITKHRQSDCLTSPVRSSKIPSSISYHPQTVIIKALASLVTDHFQSDLQTTPVICLISPVRSSDIPGPNLLSFPAPSPNRHADA